MKITKIYAENFLSFGTGKNAFQLAMDTHLTVLVGANGSGKSNVLEVVRTLQCALRGDRLDLATQRHRPDGQDRRMELRLGVVFDRPEEKACITSFFKAALAYPANDGYRSLAQIPMSTPQFGDRTQPNSVEGDRLEALADWIGSTVKARDLLPLYQGSLRLYADPELGDGVLLDFDFRLPGAGTVSLGVGRQNYQGSFYRPVRRNQSTHIAKAWIEVQPEAARQELASFLHGLPGRMPSLSIEPVSAIAQRIGEGLPVATALDQARTERPLMRDFMRAARPYGLKIEQAHLGSVIAGIILGSIAVVSDWRPQLSSTVVDEQAVATRQALMRRLAGQEPLQPAFTPESAATLADHRGAVAGWTEPTLGNLERGDLARYMLRLQHGDEADQRLHRSIQDTFESLTGQRCSVRLLDQQEGAFQVVRARLETEQAIPLGSSGSGIGQALMLSAALQGHRGSVLLLDEPEAHLHPTVKARLPGLLAEAGRESQHLVIAHSPYAVPNAGFEHVRHMRLVARHSDISPVLPLKLLADKEFRIQTKAQTLEEKAFLFSNVTCFVEGPHDVAAYSVWFDQWAEDQLGKGGYGTQIGLVFQAAYGADRLTGMLMAARAFKIPCLGVYDTDVLSAHKDFKTKNLTRIALWQQLGLVDGAPIALENEDSLRRLGAPRSMVRVLQPDPGEPIVFRRDLEDLIGDAIQKVAAVDGKDSPATYGRVAQELGLPQSHRAFLEDLFADLLALAKRATA